MKRLITNALVVLCLATASVASADHREVPRASFSSNGNAQWRLGEYRARSQGHEILYRTPGSRGWMVAPGAAVAVADGWVLGTDRHRGGHGIYRWNGRDWSRMPGAGVRIGGSYHQPWVVNDRGIRYNWNGRDWQEVRVTGNRGYRDSPAVPRGRGDRNDYNDWRRRDGYRR